MFPFEKDKYLEMHAEAVSRVKKSDKYFILRALYPFISEFLSVARALDLEYLIINAHYSHIPSLLNPQIAHFRFMGDYTSLEISGVSWNVDLSKIQKPYEYNYLATLGFIAIKKVPILEVLRVLKCKEISINSDRHDFKYNRDFVETSSRVKISYTDFSKILNIDDYMGVLEKQRGAKTAPRKDTRLIF